MPGDERRRKAGFTLIEALVSLSLVLAFAGGLGSLLFQSRQIFVGAHGQTRADILLRSLLQRPFDNAKPELGLREGESGGFHWQVEVEPYVSDMGDLEPAPRSSKASKSPKWTLFHITANVRWGAGHEIAADTLRLGHVE